jgi:hypothetical protein
LLATGCDQQARGGGVGGRVRGRVLMFTMRCGWMRWVERLGAGLAAVALIWKRARMYFLTVREVLAVMQAWLKKA